MGKHTSLRREALPMGPLVIILLISHFIFSKADISSKIGINYGELGNNLPSPYKSIEHIKSMKVGSVKLYDANPEILRLLSGTNIYVSIMVQNHEISDVASSQKIADNWVKSNVLPYYPQTMIRFVLIGNEALSYNSEKDQKLWHDLVPAMRRIKTSLRTYNIKNIKLGTPLAMDVVESTFPPSSAIFRSDVSDIVMRPLLQFLNGTKSYFFIDVYPYFPWSANPLDITLDYALFQGKINYIDPGSNLVYTNLLDQMLDSLIFAMAKLGFHDIQLVIAETGWPNGGDIDQPGANMHNAAIYNRNLAHRMATRPPLGTPARPGVKIPTFIFSLYNENQKDGPGTERHWGLLYPNGSTIFDIDLTGKRHMSDYEPLPKPTNNTPYKGRLWCVVAEGVNKTELNSALTFACRHGNGTCDALAPGGECYQPVSTYQHASYAFSSYWAQFRSQGANCYFNGLAEQTTRNPSHGSCKFPSVSL